MKKIPAIILALSILLPFAVPAVPNTPFEALTVRAATDIKNDVSLGASLVSAWEMESADIPGDVHGANDGTNTGVAASTTCPTGTDPVECGFYVNSESDRIAVANPVDDSLNPEAEDWSMAMWIYFDSWNTGGGSDTLVRKLDNAIDREYIFYHCEPVTCGTDGLRLNIDTNSLAGGGSLTFDSDTTSLSHNTWYHIGFAFDYSDGEAYFFVDGSGVGSEDLGTNIDPANGVAPFHLGYPHSNIGFNGTLDQVLFYEKLLTTADFSALYAGGDGIPYDAGAAPAADPGEEYFIPFTLVAPLRPFVV